MKKALCSLLAVGALALGVFGFSGSTISGKAVVSVALENVDKPSEHPIQPPF